jgi:hypothetical protein
MHAPADRSSGGGAAGDDSSQLIDLRTLSRMAEATTAHAAASAHRLAIPRFAASDLTRIPATPTPLLPPPSFVDLPLRRPAEDRGPLYALLAALTVAVVVLGAFVVLRPRPELVVETRATPAIAPSVIAADRELRDATAVVPERKVDAEDAPADDETPSPEGAVQRDDRAARPTTRHRAARRDRGRAASVAEGAAPATRATKASELTADCVLGLSDCGSSKAPKTPATTPPAAEAREGLPAKLTMAQLRTGVSAQKPAAKQCGRLHGASAGEEVRVRLSITGASGAVVSAAAQGEHARTELGRCVATALARADFPRFGDPAMGFVFTVRM